MDDWQLERYSVQETIKDKNDIKAKMEILWQQQKDQEAELAAARKERKVFEEDRDKYQQKYEKLRKKFEDR